VRGLPGACSLPDDCPYLSLELDELLPIDVTGGSQPCDTMGVHPATPNLASFYGVGELSFIATIGSLVEPVTKAGYLDKSARLPPSLFSHNDQQKEARRVSSGIETPYGVLGRIATALADDLSVESYSIHGSAMMLDSRTTPPFTVDGKLGVERYSNYHSLAPDLSRVLSNSSSSLYGETMSAAISSSLARSESLGQALEGAETATPFGTSDIEQQFEQVAKLIRIARETPGSAERQLFYVRKGRFDAHNSPQKTVDGLADIDAALGSFRSEMKGLGVWDDVVIASASDFGRTLTNNGLGTDHAWAGNHFVLGGTVRGGRIHGTYPSGFTEESDLNIGRGRLIPTTPWEALWGSVATWLGVDEAQVAELLPNAANFAPEQLIAQEEMFHPSPPRPPAPPPTPPTPPPPPPTTQCDSAMIVKKKCYQASHALLLNASAAGWGSASDFDEQAVACTAACEAFSVAASQAGCCQFVAQRDGRHDLECRFHLGLYGDDTPYTAGGRLYRAASRCCPRSHDDPTECDDRNTAPVPPRPPISPPPSAPPSPPPPPTSPSRLPSC